MYSDPECWRNYSIQERNTNKLFSSTVNMARRIEKGTLGGSCRLLSASSFGRKFGTFHPLLQFQDGRKKLRFLSSCAETSTHAKLLSTSGRLRRGERHTSIFLDVNQFFFIQLIWDIKRAFRSCIAWTGQKSVQSGIAQQWNDRC